MFEHFEWSTKTASGPSGIFCKCCLEKFYHEYCFCTKFKRKSVRTPNLRKRNKPKRRLRKIGKKSEIENIIDEEEVFYSEGSQN
jgi:hypothetical protein